VEGGWITQGNAAEIKYWNEVMITKPKGRKRRIELNWVRVAVAVAAAADNDDNDAVSRCAQKRMQVFVIWRLILTKIGLGR
jgi:hypothetical protein